MFTDARREQNQCFNARIMWQWAHGWSQGNGQELMGRRLPVSARGAQLRWCERAHGACNAQLCCRGMFRWIFHAPFSWCINNVVRWPAAISSVTHDGHASWVACMNARTSVCVSWSCTVIGGIVLLSAAITFCQLWILITVWWWPGCGIIFEGWLQFRGLHDQGEITFPFRILFNL